jgi:hypothetical protein
LQVELHHAAKQAGRPSYSTTGAVVPTLAPITASLDNMPVAAGLFRPPVEQPGVAAAC